MTRRLREAELQALARFRFELRRFMRQADRNAAEAGLTRAQYELLLAVRGWSGEGPPSVGALAEHLELRPHSTLELARRAEQHDLVTLHHDPADSRRQLVALTAVGRARVDRAAARNRSELDDLAAALAALDDR